MTESPELIDVAECACHKGLPMPPAFLCKFGGGLHRRGIHHEGDEPLYPASEIAGRCATAWDEGYNVAYELGFAAYYDRSGNPYRAAPVDGSPDHGGNDA